MRTEARAQPRGRRRAAPRAAAPGLVPVLPPEVLIANWRDTGHPEGGGSEFYLEQLAAGLVREGYRVTLVCARYAGSARREQRGDGVTVVRVGGRLSLYPRVAAEYLRGRLGSPSLIIEVQNGMPFLARLWARGVPVVVLVHHVHREQWRVVLPAPLARIGWWLESRVAPRVNSATQYVTVSESTRSELAELGVDLEHIAVVHNGTPAAQPGTPLPRTADPSLVVVSRLVPHKRIEIAIDTVAQLAGDYPGLTLTVAGRGWWDDQLRAYAQQRGVADRVVFAGFVTDAEKARLYQQSWVSLIPSLKEGWGLVVVEAGTYRTPSIGFRDAGGVAESIVDGRTGLLANSQADFSAQIGELLEDSDRRTRLGDAAQRYAASFSWDATMREFDAVLATFATGGHDGTERQEDEDSG